jgi:two-component system, NarL family, sensor kinase
LLLPDGRLVSRRWRAALVLAVAAVVTQSLALALTPYESWSPALEAAGAVNPMGADWVLTNAVQIPLDLVGVAAVAVACGSLAVRRHRSAGVQRQQLKWILLGFAFTFLLFSVGFAAGPVFTALAMVPLPAACLVAVLRHRLWDVDVVISRSLRYGGLIAAVVALYIACVGLLGGLLGHTTGAPLIATAVVAVCAEPLHRRLWALVNRLVYGQPDDPFAVLARAGQRLAGARDGPSVADEVLPEVVAAVAAALRLPHVAVTLADGATIEHGAREDTAAQIPLTYGGQLVGHLRYSPPPGGLRPVSQRLLDDLARHAAVAAHTVVLARDLARSREQLVAAREEERHWLHRELHDGLGPSLAALAVQVETARELTPADPAAAQVLLERASSHLTSAVDEVRTIVRGLRSPPPDRGLASALHELGDSFAAPGLAVSVQVAGVQTTLPATAEAAAYRITAEALANAARHSGASSVAVRVRQRNGALKITVADNGRGCPPDPPGQGLGIPSMRERARGLGGTFAIRAGDGGRGTCVEATLPLGSAGAGADQPALVGEDRCLGPVAQA